jgi:hypothetical protein
MTYFEENGVFFTGGSGFLGVYNSSISVPLDSSYFSLESSSLGIDSGSEDYSSEEDVEGNLRDSNPDIGAYEY